MDWLSDVLQAKDVYKVQRCYLETYGNPVLLLQPVKYEVIHEQPDIFMLHDVAFDSQIERIKAAARKDLRRAMVVIPGTDLHEAARIRISKRFVAVIVLSRDVRSL